MSNTPTSRQNYYRKAQLIAPPRACDVCGKPTAAFDFKRRRSTCSDVCHKTLMRECATRKAGEFQEIPEEEIYRRAAEIRAQAPRPMQGESGRGYEIPLVVMR